MVDAWIRAWASAEENIDGLHAARFGRTFRRISRYVKLAQVGAASCLDGIDPGSLGRVGVFLGSGLGNTADVVPLAEGVLHPDRAWASPMAFAGCVGNAAAFYVARTLGLSGPNLTVSQEEVSFEAALQEALLALAAGGLDHALVGGVDVRTGSDSVHRLRMNAVDVPGRVGEGTGWLLLSPGAAPRTDQPRILDAWVRREPTVPPAYAHLAILPGWRWPQGDLPREERLLPVATALRIVDVLAGREQTPPRVLHLQRTAGGLVGGVALARGTPR